MGSRNTKALLLILAASLLAGRRPLAAQTPLRLSFADAVRVASSETPAVALAALRTDEADARVREARGALLPSLSLGGSWLNRTFNSKTLGFDFSFPLPGGGTASLPDLIGPFNVYDARFSAAQTLFDWSSVTRVKAAGAQADGSRAEHGATVERSAVTAAVAYVQAVRAAALVDARRADSTLAAELATLAQAQKAAGVSAAIDLTRAQVQLTVAQGQLLVARNQADGARIDLTRALGLDPATPFTLTDTLAPSLGVAAVAEERDSAISTALANRPDLRVEQAHGVAARRTGSAIRAERLPRLAVVGDYGVSGRTVPQAISTYDPRCRSASRFSTASAARPVSTSKTRSRVNRKCAKPTCGDRSGRTWTPRSWISGRPKRGSGSPRRGCGWRGRRSRRRASASGAASPATST